jgi:8-oxo-dGTP pyrophosphatase MutT (NUDIX family)
MRKQFVATAIIVDKGKVLLVNHKKLGMWLPPGGHIEEGETPDEALVREVAEETGYGIEIVSPAYKAVKDSRTRPLATPLAVQLEDIDAEHQHIDFLYLCRLKPSSGKKGDHEMRWLPPHEIDSINTPENVKKTSKEAIKIFESNNL